LPSRNRSARYSVLLRVTVNVARRQFGSFDFALTRYASGTNLPWHAHEKPYVTIVLDGSYRESLAGGTRECDARSIIYHPAGERHTDEFGSRATACLDVHLRPAWLESLREAGCAIEKAALAATPAARDIASRLELEFGSPDTVSPIAIEALLLQLFAENERRRDSRPPTAPLWLRRVRERLEACCTENASLTDLAASAGVHPTHLAREFRRHFGSTIGTFVRSARVELAKRRVRADEPLGDIALDLGFADQSHFSRVFRQFTGLSPAAFRRSAR
jgi:AraC family transcriptional regulator